MLWLFKSPLVVQLVDVGGKQCAREEMFGAKSGSNPELHIALRTESVFLSYFNNKRFFNATLLHGYLYHFRAR